MPLLLIIVRFEFRTLLGKENEKIIGQEKKNILGTIIFNLFIMI